MVISGGSYEHIPPAIDTFLIMNGAFHILVYIKLLFLWHKLCGRIKGMAIAYSPRFAVSY